MKLYFAYDYHMDHTRIGYDYVEVRSYINELPDYERSLAELAVRESNA